MGSVKPGQRSEYVVLPGGRTYAVLKTQPPTGFFVAEIKLYEKDTEISSSLWLDARRNGERSFTMISESLPVTELDSSRPRLTWLGDIWRGNDRQWLAPERKDVQAVVVHRITVSHSGSPEEACPVLMFGGESELYTVSRGGDGQSTIELVQVSSAMRSRDQADALMRGSCITPEIDKPFGLPAHQRAGRVGRGSRGSKLVWSKIETIARF
ncbi:MAG: hypothetical protein FJ146_04370 [Deltaproteobacteria bacterium]|nr:hypothetical protein [Deltaproteobacteria bacterium]